MWVFILFYFFEDIIYNLDALKKIIILRHFSRNSSGNIIKLLRRSEKKVQVMTNFVRFLSQCITTFVPSSRCLKKRNSRIFFESPGVSIQNGRSEWKEGFKIPN